MDRNFPEKDDSMGKDMVCNPLQKSSIFQQLFRTDSFSGELMMQRPFSPWRSSRTF